MKQTIAHRKFLHKRLTKLYEKHDKFMKKFKTRRYKLLQALNERAE